MTDDNNKNNFITQENHKKILDIYHNRTNQQLKDGTFDAHFTLVDEKAGITNIVAFPTALGSAEKIEVKSEISPSLHPNDRKIIYKAMEYVKLHNDFAKHLTANKNEIEKNKIHTYIEAIETHVYVVKNSVLTENDIAHVTINFINKENEKSTMSWDRLTASKIGNYKTSIKVCLRDLARDSEKKLDKWANEAPKNFIEANELEFDLDEFLSISYNQEVSNAGVDADLT